MCGFKVPYTDLQPNVVLGRLTGVMACGDCSDPDHPQNYTGTIKSVDGIALRNFRPDNQVAASTAVFVPIYVGAGASFGVGRPTVEIS